MDMDQAAVFLAGSILTAMGFVILVAGIVAINNILHKYWKPVTFINWNYPPHRFIEEEKIPPTVDGTK